MFDDHKKGSYDVGSSERLGSTERLGSSERLGSPERLDSPVLLTGGTAMFFVVAFFDPFGGIGGELKFFRESEFSIRIAFSRVLVSEIFRFRQTH